MPSTRFATELLKGAQGGLGQGLQAAFGAGHRRQQAEDNAMLLQSRVAQALANIRQSDAAADLSAAKADGETVAADALRGRPGQLEESVALSTGTGLPIVQAVRAGARAGTAPQMELPGPTMDGGALTGPIDPTIVSKVGQALARVLPLMSNAKDFNPQQLAAAADSYRDQDLSQAVLDGQADPRRVAAAQAAAAGKPMFHSDATGGVLDLFGGRLDTANPMAASTIGLRGAQAQQAAAGATRNAAQARAADATAELRTAQTGAVGTAGRKPPAHYEYFIDPDTGETALRFIKGGKADPNAQTAKPLPTSALKMQQQELDAIGTSGTINADLGSIEKQIRDGNLKIGLVRNAVGTAQNFVGASSENSRNLSTFKSTLEKLRNDSLRLNTGVQTEGDAIRAWNEMLANINDQDVVLQRLGEIQRINERAASLRRMNVDVLRNNYGLPSLDAEAEQRYNQPAAVGPAGAPAAAPAPRPGRVDLNAGRPDRIAILQQEWLRQPADREQIGREIRRLGGQVPTDRRSTPQPAAAPASGGFRYIGTE